MPTPTLIFNPITSVELSSSFAVLDSAATVTDGGNVLNAIQILLGGTTGSLGVVNAGTLTISGTIGLINYQYTEAKRLLTLRDNTAGQTALGADFTAVLRLVAFDRGSSIGGSTRSISINLGSPIYLANNGRYYDFVAGSISGDNLSASVNTKNFLGLVGYLANVTSAVKTTFLVRTFGFEGWIGGNSLGNFTSKPRVWKWGAGPESNTTFWTGDFNDGVAPAGQYTNWSNGRPNNDGFPSDPNNVSPFMTSTAEGLWAEQAGRFIFQGYYIEYSTVSGVGDDGLGGTRKTTSMLVNFDPVIIALLQATTAIEVSLVDGAVTSAIGVPMGNITIGATNATHIQVSINLGTNNAGKRRQARGFRVIGGSERELIATRTQVGEIYNFVFLKTSVEGSTSVNLLLS